MENAADALKIAFAVLVFVIALSIFFSLTTQIKTTADTILFYSDRESYLDDDDYITGGTEESRIVGEDTIISALYNQEEELTYITIINNGNDKKEFIPNDKNTDRVSYIKDKLNKGKTYSEKIYEITTGGTYKVGDDGTKIVLTPGTTRTYITYTERI